MSEVCKAADLQGFPTWVINGQKLEGDQTFDQLATASNFKR
jgi:protein-disulfide isomerase